MTIVDRRYSVAEGTAVKAPCRVATTANITLSGEQTIDGVAVVDGDRVLVKNQSTASENGIYQASTGNWSRARDWDGPFDVVTGTRVIVNLGTANARSEWIVTTTGEITVGTTSVALTLLGGTGSPFPDGTVGSPGAYFTNYPSYGWYKTASGIGISINGALASEFLATGMAVTGLGINAATAFTDPAIGDEFPAYDLSATANKKITFANYLKVINGLTEDTSPDRAADYVVTYDASAGVAKKVLVGNLGVLPPGAIYGLTLSNGADATNDINIAAGKCRDDSDTYDISLSAITKQLDAPWAVGTNQGGRDAGAISDTTWHVWAIKRLDTGITDVLFSSSPSSPTMPTNYTVKRRIGSIIRSGGAILAFVQYGDDFFLSTPVLDVDASQTTTAALRALTVPDGIKVNAFMHVFMNVGSATIALYVSSPDVSDLAPSNSAAPLSTIVSGATASDPNNSGQIRVYTDTSRQVRTRTNATATIRIATIGWSDSRNRHAA